MMGFAKIVTINELKENNPTLCLSALRVFNHCHKCTEYKQFQKGYIKKLKCVPHLDQETLNKIERLNQLKEQVKELEKEIEVI